MAKGKTVGGIAGASAATIALAIALIQPWEGRELRAYRDIVGVLTICDGDTHNVKPGQVATPAECDQRLYTRLMEFKSELDKCLTYPVPAKVEAAFLSWTWNVGPHAACNSTLVRRANAGRLEEACDQLLAWDKAGRPLRVVRGLTLRRQAERAYCYDGLAGR